MMERFGDMQNHINSDWMTKPTDRFILRWIKCRLSARITPGLSRSGWVRPWMVTIVSTGLGVLAGIIFAVGWGGLAGVIAAASQILDGVDGQLARMTGRVSKFGAFLDSVLDRYADGAMMIGMIVYASRMPGQMPVWLVLVVGGIALIGSNLISYSKARADSLGLYLGKPTLASKGTRMTVMSLSGLFSLIWPMAPVLALWYLAIHASAVVAKYIFMAKRSPLP
jgi:phosphatidylglycerophosphate synthase